MSVLCSLIRSLAQCSPDPLCHQPPWFTSAPPCQPCGTAVCWADVRLAVSWFLDYFGRFQIFDTSSVAKVALCPCPGQRSQPLQRAVQGFARPTRAVDCCPNCYPFACVCNPLTMRRCLYVHHIMHFKAVSHIYRQPVNEVA